MTNRRRRSVRGFTLAEVLVAGAIFLIVAVAAYTALSDSNRLYKQGDAAAEMQQRTRLAFDLLLAELRLAGFDNDRDGDENPYPNQSDEQLEFVAEHAITFRANLDFDDENMGREADAEDDPEDADFGTVCCPIVTIGNDEIVTYALRSDDTEANTDVITLKLDTSLPRNGTYDEDGAVVGEETVVIENVDLSGDNPPYTLMRITLADDGTLVERAVVSGVRALSFTYGTAALSDAHCVDFEDDGTCLSTNQVPFIDLAGGDDVTTGDLQGRAGRAAIRNMAVEFVGMTELDEPRYADPDDSLLPHRRKLALTGLLSPPNLGLRGRPDLDDMESYAPTNVSACVGQCNTIRVEWDDVDRALAYRVNLFLGTATVPFLQQVTPGIRVPDSDPRRVYAIYQRLDAPDLHEGSSIVATVESRLGSDEFSEPSDPSTAVTIGDVARIASPTDLVATGYDPGAAGWPDLASAEIVPETYSESPYAAQVNQITVSWVPPAWLMDLTDPTDPDTWTAVVSESTHPAVACDADLADTDGDTVGDKMRSRNREMFGDIRFLVFRSTNPRFIPTAADVVASVPGTVDTATGRVSFTDRTIHSWRSGVFNGSVSMLQTCTTYYYRVRAVDDCFTGTDPSSTTDLHLSPFFPPLNAADGVADTDDVDGVSPSEIGLAIPGYAIPQARPKAPQALRFSNQDNRTDDGDGIDATIGFDAVKLDTKTVTGPTGDPVSDPDDIVISQYRVYAHPSDQGFNRTQAITGTGGVYLVKTIDVRDLAAGRIAYDDEDGVGGITTAEDETVTPYGMTGSPLSALRIDAPSGEARYYKVAAVYCTGEGTVPSPDGTNWDVGDLSRWQKFPCQFGGGPYSTINCDATAFPTSVTATAFVDNPLQRAERAWLVLKDPATGDRVMSSSSKDVNAAGVVTFNSSEIAALTDNFGNGTYRVSVEMRDSEDCTGVSDTDDIAPTVPSCCLTPAEQFVTRVGASAAYARVTEACGALGMRIHRITITIVNANKGQPERLTGVSWGSTLIWSGSSNKVVIDRSSNPLTLAPYATKDLNLTLNRNLQGDNVLVTYEYRIGGYLGLCSFQTLSVP